MKLHIANASKSFGAEDVLIKATLEVKNTEKIALVGRNGSGKTTLLKLITGEEQMDGGSRVISSGVEVGYLAQITFQDDENTVEEELLKVFDHLKQVEHEMLEQAIVLETDSSQAQLEKYDRLQNLFETLGGYDYEFEMRSVFFHFGFTEEDLKKKISEFSSGQRTRIALVKLLLKKPDVLLLDEPTNHLDIDSVEWLENYIRHYPNAVILVSHDRTFLDRVADEIVEIEFGRTTRYPGNYSHYVKAKEDFIASNHEAYVRQQKEIEKLSALIEKFRYKASKASFAQSKIKYLERMDKVEDIKTDKSSIKAEFSADRRSGSKVLEVQNLQVGYDQILSTVNMTLMAKDRMAIVGPNGIGKSTFIKTLMGLVEQKGGQFEYGHHVDVGYFDQDSAQMKSDKTVLDELWDEHPLANQTQIRNALASFLFRQDEVFKEVNALSGGERVRLALTKLMMDHDNLLILDEPTNHLDIPAKEALEKALQNYDGTILFVSHDRMFLSKMASKILEMDTVSKVYDADYQEYVQKKKEGQLSQLPSVSDAPEKKKQEKPERQSLSFQERKSVNNRIAKLEKLLEEAEKDKEALLELKYEPEFYQDYRKMEELEQQIDDKSNEIESYMKEWEEKMALMEANS